MRVALHTGQLDQPAPGGIGRYVEGLVRHLPWVGIQVVPFAPGRLRTAAWHRLRRGGPGVDVEADLVHAPSLAVPPAGGLPLVVTVHDLAFLTHPDCFPPRGRTFHEQGLALTREEAAAVVVPSAATAAEVVEVGGVDKERVHVVPHGVTITRDPAPADVAARLARLGLAGQEAAPYLLFVGTLEPRKALDVLLAAHALLRESHPNLRLVVAGPKGWGPAPDLDRPGVVAAGRVDEAELDALYRGAALLAVPSLTEGFGLPALEAMSRRCPVVVSEAGALPEVVGGAGVLVPVGDAEALAAAAGALLADPELRVEMAEAGRRRAGEFTWAACLDGHLRAYRAAVAVGTGTPPAPGDSGTPP